MKWVAILMSFTMASQLVINNSTFKKSGLKGLKIALNAI